MSLNNKLVKCVDFRWTKVLKIYLFNKIFFRNVKDYCNGKLEMLNFLVAHCYQMLVRHIGTRYLKNGIFLQSFKNECVDQFAGAHALLSEGSGEIIRKLAEGTEIRCGYEVVIFFLNFLMFKVNKIDYTRPRKTIVHCSNGKKFTCDKVHIKKF